MEPAAGAAGAEGGLLAWLGTWLFDPPRSTAAVLGLIAGLAACALLLRRLVLEPRPGGRALLGALRRVEMGLLALLLLGMVLLSAVQIFMRNVLGAGILWVDPLLRYLTLWIGFAGAALAAAEGRHIRIDALARSLAPGLRRAAGRVTHLAAAAIASVLAESAYRHLASEHAFDARDFLGLPTWLLLAVIPTALAVIAYRFLDAAIVPPPDEVRP